MDTRAAAAPTFAQQVVAMTLAGLLVAFILEEARPHRRRRRR